MLQEALRRLGNISSNPPKEETTMTKYSNMLRINKYIVKKKWFFYVKSSIVNSEHVTIFGHGSFFF